MVDDYIRKREFSKAADLFRLFIVYNEGGVYLDFDQIIYEYDIALHKFDFVGYSTPYHEKYLLIEMSYIAGIAGHPAPGLGVS